MTLETVTNLNEETVEAVQDLIQANIDSANGFRESAEVIEDQQLSALFLSMASTRTDLANELKTHVSLSKERPRIEGSWLAALHRTWIDIRGKLNSGDPTIVLIEAERGEDFIKRAYEEVLKKTAGSAINDVLQRQYADVKKGHDSIRDLRDALKSA